jgi:hypothetical protein
MTEHLCVCCPQLRQGEPRPYERECVCEGCRARLRTMLAEVVDLYAELSLDKAVGVGARVSGSRTPPLPLAVTPLDLTMPPHGTVSDDLVPLYERQETTAKVYTHALAWKPCDCEGCQQARARAREEGKPDPTKPHVSQPVEVYALGEVTLSQRRRKRDANGWLAYGPSGDQVGEPSAPTVLESWARDWQTYRWALLPEPSVAALSRWLTERLDWACDEHPAIDDFAYELNDLARRLRPRAPKPELKLGVPCRECDKVSLYRWPGSDYVECGSCPCLMTPDEYRRWTELISAPEHQPWVREVVAAQREPVAS